MGMKIVKNEKGLYQSTSSISGEKTEWMTKEQFKVWLIETAYWKFIEATVKIDKEFPESYRVNNESHKNHTTFLNWWSDSDFDFKVLHAEFEKVMKKLDVNLDLEED